jgi:hypothetical protein
MNLEGNNYYRDLQSLHDECKRCLHFHVVLTMVDGSTLDGIIQDVDKDRVIILVGEDIMEQDDGMQFDQQRQFPHHGRPRRRFRRFRPRAFPFNTLVGLSLLGYPFFAPPFFVW